MTIDEVRAYPTRLRVAHYARIAINCQMVHLAAEIFADEYLGEMRVLPKEDKPPCGQCNCETVYFCYLTETECRAYALWVDSVR